MKSTEKPDQHACKNFKFIFYYCQLEQGSWEELMSVFSKMCL